MSVSPGEVFHKYYKYGRKHTVPNSLYIIHPMYFTWKKMDGATPHHFRHHSGS